MPSGTAERISLGPFSGGMRNSSGNGENIKDDEVFELTNLEVDLDGSLVNRPAIRVLGITGISGDLGGIRVLGKYLPNDGRVFLVVYVPTPNTVRLVDINSGAANAVSATVAASCVVQYNNKLWVIPSQGSAQDGGSFDATNPTITWTADADIPKGECAVLYKDRIFVGCGIEATTNTSRFRYCDVGDPTTWPGSNFVDVSPGDGEKLVDMISLANDIIIFKEHSTWRYGYTSLPSKAETSRIDSTVGVPAVNCAVPYDNNKVYVLHDNSVYELYNSRYTKISNPIAMTQITDGALYSDDQYGLTLSRDRLFVRYFSKLYVYTLKTNRWSSWVTNRKFSKVINIPSASVGLDTAFAHSATTADPGKVFYFRDDRITEVGDEEAFTCTVITKIYDLGQPEIVKTQFWGAVQIATSGILTTKMSLPNSTQNNTWTEEEAENWEDPGLWDSQDFIIYETDIPPEAGAYARKLIKSIQRKLKFRQAFYTLSTPAIAPLDTADSSVKIFKIILFVRSGQLVPKETN